MDTSSIRTAIATGNVREIIDVLGADRRVDYMCADLMGGEPGMITIAQVGRALITVMPDGMTQVKVHAHGEDRDEECWSHLVAEAEAMVAEHNRQAEAIAGNPVAAMLLRMGAPIEEIEAMIAMRDGVPPGIVAPGTSLPTIQADPGPTGFYL